MEISKSMKCDLVLRRERDLKRKTAVRFFASRSKAYYSTMRRPNLASHWKPAVSSIVDGGRKSCDPVAAHRARGFCLHAEKLEERAFARVA
jgi:hypothetical protein